MTRYSVLKIGSRDRLAVSVTVCHYKPICFSDKISLDPSLSSEMSLGLVEIECPYSLRNTDCLKEENGVISLKKSRAYYYQCSWQ